ncbi:MAG: type IV toxin-antitoxin system AbiEi family antitoxin domain-containing protein [Chloroflexota bacterium]
MSSVATLHEDLAARGRYVVTTDEIADLIGPSPNTSGRLVRLRRSGRLVSPAKGLYVVVPPEYRAWGAPPAEWFIDGMMARLSRRYYVGLLTAAALHGAAHQAAQVYQVVVDKKLEDRDLGRVRLRFYQSSHLPDAIDARAVERRTSQTGYYQVSDRELTAIDLVEFQQVAGGLGNIATVLSELGQLRGDHLAQLTLARPKAVVRRLGWLLSRFSPETDVSSLRDAAAPDPSHPVPLDPGDDSGGPVDAAWGVAVNTEIEADT